MTEYKILFKIKPEIPFKNCGMEITINSRLGYDEVIKKVESLIDKEFAK